MQVAAGCGHSDQTGREGQQQSVAASIQWQRQELTGLRRVLTTPGHHETDISVKTGGQRLRSQQTQVNALFLASHQSVRGSEALSVALILIQHQFYLHFVQKLQWRKFKSLLCPLCYHFKVSFYSNNAQELNLKLQRFPGVTKSWMASKQEQFIQTRCLFSTLGQIRAGTFSWPINMPADRKLFWSFSKLECQIFSCSSQSLSSSFCVFKCSWLNLCISHMFTLSPVGHLK